MNPIAPAAADDDDDDDDDDYGGDGFTYSWQNQTYQLYLLLAEEKRKGLKEEEKRICSRLITYFISELTQCQQYH